MEIDVGSKIKKLRKEKNISIAELSKRSGVSSGLISQVERNTVNPSVATLWKISESLNASIGYFFNEEPAPVFNPIVKKDKRKRIVTSDSNATYELLTPDLNRKIEFLYIAINPGDSSRAGLIKHDGEECGIVIKGKLMVKTEDEEYILEEGDSIYLDSTVPHRYINLGEDECISVWAMTPPSF